VRATRSVEDGIPTEDRGNEGKPNVRDSQQITEYVEERIGQVYLRPLMYGGSADGVDNLLHWYHDLWAVIHQREDDFLREASSAHADEGCDSANFAFHYRRDRPSATEAEVAGYVVSMWRRIGERLGVPATRVRLG
jgi:hypothetical protein